MKLWWLKFGLTHTGLIANLDIVLQTVSDEACKASIHGTGLLDCLLTGHVPSTTKGEIGQILPVGGFIRPSDGLIGNAWHFRCGQPSTSVEFRVCGWFETMEYALNGRREDKRTAAVTHLPPS